jgi:hypothetical protein
VKGYVYVLSNPSMPGVLKIGRSAKGGAERAKSFYQTGVANPFTVEFELLTDDCCWLESEVHKELNSYRVNPDREFFSCAPYEAMVAICRLHLHGNSDHRVVHGEESDALVDLMALAYRLNIPTLDVYSSAIFLTEFSVKQAIAARDECYAKHGVDPAAGECV